MIINALLFNAMWFGCIYWGNAFIPLVLVWAFFHLQSSSHTAAETRFVIVVTLVGTLVDTCLIHLGVFVFESHPFVIPLWLVAIWLSFSLTLNSSLNFLKHSIKLQYVIGAIAPPFSYFAGSKLGAVTFGYSLPISLLAISLTWLCLLPFLYKLNQNFMIAKEQHA